MSKRIPIFFGLILVIAAIWLLITPRTSIRYLIDQLETLGYDLQLRLHVITDKPERLSPIAIIDIDDKSLQAEGRWPWSRTKLATLVDQIVKQGGAVIVFDIFFSEAQTNIAQELLTILKQKNVTSPELESIVKANQLIFNEDEQFAKSLSQTTSTLAITFLPREQTQNELPPPLVTLTPKEQNELAIIKAMGYISNIPILQQASKGSGFINVFPDVDGIVRRAPLLIEYKNQIYPSLALQAVISFLDKKVSLVTPSYGDSNVLEGISLGDMLIPTDGSGQVLIPFIGKSYTFPYYSAHDVIKGNIPPDALAGKILFVGSSATGLGDLQATAIESPFPGVEIQASLANGILQNNFSYIPAWTYGANLVITLLIGLLGAFIFPFFGPRLLGLLIILLPLAFLFLNNWIWKETHLILSFLLPILLIISIAFINIIYGYLFETRRRERLKNMFGQYVPAKHIDEMLQASGDYALGGEDRDMSVLFADIRNFTTISEGMSAANLVDMLNTFFTPMTEIIFKHRGTIDKYVGDMIMAFWGAPLKNKNHARDAIQSALEMQAKINDLKAELEKNNWPLIQIGIGINSGIMSVGDMGSRFRRNYTVLGDAVNLASRVEGLTKFYGVDIIVTEQTKTNQPKFVFRELDRVKVKGKHKGVAIFEVICLASQLTEPLINELERYNEALHFYFAQHWDQALAIFSALHEIYPDKKIYKIYQDRIKEFQLTPPNSDWDGVYVHAHK